MGVHARAQEVLAPAHRGGVTALWESGGADAGFGGRAIYLYAVLMSYPRGSWGRAKVWHTEVLCRAQRRPYSDTHADSGIVRKINSHQQIDAEDFDQQERENTWQTQNKKPKISGKS